jgi:starch-binding outer membrane protein, SusD/RagB family
MKLIKLLAGAGLMLTVTTSCNKVLDIKETDLIAGEVALKTVTNNEQAVLGAYGGFAIEMDILMNSVFSDEVKTAEFYNSQTTHEWAYSPTDVGIRDNYTAINPQYRTIDRANRVLEALPKADSTVVGDNVKRSRLRGEALFLRAFAHFQLFRYYCGNYSPTGLAMPYMEKSSIGPQSRIQMLPYFQKMNADITEAKTLLPNNLTDINRANVASANGLHARVALYQRDWANAEIYATNYINALPLASMADFPGIWTDARTAEVAYQIVRNANNRIGSLFRGTSPSTTKLGQVIWRPTDKLWNTFDQVRDIRFASYLKAEPLLTSDVPTRPNRIVAKYAGSGYGSTNENVNNAKIMRTGEMYLIRAEARAEQNKLSGANSAESDINTLRTARITGYANITYATKQAAIDDIMLERFKELAFEGQRFWDLKRRGLPVERIPAEAPTAAGTTLPANDYRFLLPIPFTELQANSAMTQNPGYN